jgi:hypothetical protein
MSNNESGPSRQCDDESRYGRNPCRAMFPNTREPSLSRLLVILAHPFPATLMFLSIWDGLQPDADYRIRLRLDFNFRYLC